MGAIALMTLASPSAEASQPTPASAPRATSEPAPLPPKGNAMYGLGIAGVAFGILNIGYGVPLAIVCPADACFPGYIPLAFGVAFIAAGAPAIHFGKRRRAAYRAWRERVAFDPRDPPPSEDPAPSTGVGFLVGGSVAVGVGSGVLIPSLLELGTRRGDTGERVPLPPVARAGIGLGAISLAFGAVMLGFGGHLAHQRRAWIRSRSTVVASPWLVPGGFGLGVAGQF